MSHNNDVRARVLFNYTNALHSLTRVCVCVCDKYVGYSARLKGGGDTHTLTLALTASQHIVVACAQIRSQHVHTLEDIRTHLEIH